MAPQQVVVFIDEKNIYKGARRAFFQPTDHHTCGQFYPVKLAELICSRLPHGIKEKRELHEVRLYTGRPSPSYEPKSYGAHMKQCASWEKAGATVVPRPLRYPTGVPPGEQKGVDVALAVDFVTMAIDDPYDVGIIFSTDTDLKPALEFVVPRESTRAEVACWWSQTSVNHLKISGDVSPWNHRLTEEDFKLVCDYKNYSKA